MKAIHLTSVHSPYDPRILHKECRTLAQKGFEVVLIAPASNHEIVNGVRIRAVHPPSSRAQRIWKTVPAVLTAAWAEQGDIYHIHDPELIPVGILLRLRGVPVIYDVHEDYVTSVRQKDYLSPRARQLLAMLVAAAERWSTLAFEIVIAERYYSERFPHATPVLNYPVLDDGLKTTPLFGTVRNLLYTGSVSIDRGALNYARLLHYLPGFKIHLVGRISSSLLELLRAAAQPHEDRLVVPFVDHFVPPSEISEYCRKRRWLAGLSIFPRTPHYARKELTKFFQYMAFGLPIIATDFPVWAELFRRTGAGITVAPDDYEGIAAIIRDLAENSLEAAAVGCSGREAVAANFRWDSQAKVLLQLYAQLGGARSPT